MKNFKLILYISMLVVFFIVYYFILSNVSIGGITTVKIEEKDSLFVGLGEVCSNPSIVIKCEEGLVCATEDLKINFDSTKEFGTCVKIEELKNKTNS